MIDFLFALGQFICVAGLIYGALLATVRVDWLEDLPPDSFKRDQVGGHADGDKGRAATEQSQTPETQLRAL